jgi:hypothetical protein
MSFCEIKLSNEFTCLSGELGLVYGPLAPEKRRFKWIH